MSDFLWVEIATLCSFGDDCLPADVECVLFAAVSTDRGARTTLTKTPKKTANLRDMANLSFDRWQ